MLDDFMVRAALAGIGVAFAAAPLGCFVVWRRMAYFGDATAHAAILGVALSLAFSMSIFVGTMTVALLMALVVSVLSGRGYAMDTLLGVLAHSALAFGLVAVSLISGVRIDLMAYLFGDILAVSRGDLAVIWGGAALVVALIGWRWSALLTSTLNEDLAYASGINPKREQLVIAAMLIIPAAAARPLSRTPEGMAVAAGLIGMLSAIIGLRAAFVLDTPAGPSIVCVAAMTFLATSVLRGFRHQR
jgi:zinc transport system permease protein